MPKPDATDPGPTLATPSQEDLELLVLSVLAHESPLYGYAVAKRIAARSEGSFRVSPGVLYPLLAQFEKQGLIAGKWEEVRSTRGETSTTGRRRKWYELTTKGRRRLMHRIQAHRAYTKLIESFIAPNTSNAPNNVETA